MKKLFAAATGYARLARLLALCCLSNAALAALPSGGQIVAGSGQFSQSGTRLSIVQESQFMVTEWADFSIGAGETVSISQPSADSALLISVLSETPAEIAGKLQSNGMVVIVSPADFDFGAAAAFDVAGLIISTTPIANQDFMAGQLQSGGCGTGCLSGAVNASVGSISSDAGSITLNGVGDITIAGSFANSGVLTTGGAVTLTANTATTAPAGGDISLVGATITAASPDLTVTPVGGTVTLATAEAIYLGTLSQQMVSAANTYVLNTAGAVFGTSAIVATAGLATPEGAPVDLAGLSVSPNMQVNAGWNLLGNSTDAPLEVAAAFGDAGHINSVWKWLPATSRWAFYTPSLSAQELADYAAGKGYDVLASIAGGEGFWVNAQAPFVFALPFGSLLPAATVQTSLTPGWNLVSVGEDKTPSQFGAALAQSQAADTTVWAWDKTQAKWYFHAPSLEAQGGTALADYIAGKGYLDFGAAAKSLGAGMGFWVRKP